MAAGFQAGRRDGNWLMREGLTADSPPGALEAERERLLDAARVAGKAHSAKDLQVMLRGDVLFQSPKAWGGPDDG